MSQRERKEQELADFQLMYLLTVCKNRRRDSRVNAVITWSSLRTTGSSKEELLIPGTAKRI